MNAPAPAGAGNPWRLFAIMSAAAFMVSLDATAVVAAFPALRASYDSVSPGALAWVLICLWSGYYFGQIPWVKDHFESVMVAVVLVSVLPIAVEYVLARRRSAGEALAPVDGLSEPAEELRAEAVQR